MESDTPLFFRPRVSAVTLCAAREKQPLSLARALSVCVYVCVQVCKGVRACTCARMCVRVSMRVLARRFQPHSLHPARWPRECPDRREVHTCPDAGSSTHSGISCSTLSEKCRFMLSASPLLPASPPPPSPLPTALRAGLTASWATAEPPVAPASRPLLASDARTGRRASRDTDEVRRMSRTCPINAACASVSRAGPTPSVARAQPPARAGRHLLGG